MAKSITLLTTLWGWILQTIQAQEIYFPERGNNIIVDQGNSLEVVTCWLEPSKMGA